MTGTVNHAFVPDLDAEIFQDKLEKKKEEKIPNYDPNPSWWPQIIGTIAASLGQFAIGVIFGFTGVTLPDLKNSEAQFYIENHQVSLFSSIINIGSIFGSMFSGPSMVWVGQRITLITFLPIGIIGWIVMSQSYVYWLILLSRILLGFTIGICAGCCNNYVVEIVHYKIRGRMMAMNDLFRQLGFMFVYLVGSTNISWRNVGLICGIISIALPFIMIFFLPNSPRWLVTQGRKQEAHSSLVFYRGKNFDVDTEHNNIINQIESSAKSKSVIDQLKLLTEKSIAIRICILSFLLYASHFTGNFTMVTYSVSIFESTKSGINEYMSTLISAATRIVGVLIYIIFADKVGRRPLLMIPLFLSGICMGVVGVYFYLQLKIEDVSSISWVPLVALVFFTMFTTMSHPVIMLFRSELLPNSVRAVGVGILYWMFFLGTFTVALTYPYMVEDIGSHWTFWVYAMTSFIMVGVVYAFIPETQGKSLEEIEDLFTSDKHKKDDIKL